MYPALMKAPCFGNVEYGREPPPMFFLLPQVVNYNTRIYHNYWSVDLPDWFPDQMLRKQVPWREPGVSPPLQYGYRVRDDSKKITEEQIREKKGQLNPFEVWAGYSMYWVLGVLGTRCTGYSEHHPRRFCHHKSV